MREAFFIVGPTAVGKTEIAVEAAAFCGAEIVSADAFQVYAGLVRLTAKPSAEDLARVRHHLIGHVPLAETYNVARWLTEARSCLQDAALRQRPVIVVGGNGLYIKALTHGLSPLPPAQPELRAELDHAPLPELLARLRSLDPDIAAHIDARNKRRVVRALEVCIATGAPFSAQRNAWQAVRPPVRGVFLLRDRQELADRIDRRAESLLTDEALEETRDALRSSFSDTASRIIGLREIGAFLSGEMSRDDCLESVRTATRRYAKRQMTWFRGETFERSVNLSTSRDVLACARQIAEEIAKEPVVTSSIGDKRAEP